MSALYNRLKEDQLTARKNKQTPGLVVDSCLTTKIITYVLGEIGRQKVADTGDDAVLKVLKTTIKRLQTAYEANPTEIMGYEIAVLTSYVPEELSGDALEAAIRDLDFSTIGEAMSKIKKWDVPVNMKQASLLISGML